MELGDGCGISWGVERGGREWQSGGIEIMGLLEGGGFEVGG